MILANPTSARSSGPASPYLPRLSPWSAVYRPKQLDSPQATSPASYGHFQKLLSIRFAFDSPRIGVDRQITWSLLEIQILYCTTYLNSTTIRLKNEDVMPFLNLNAMWKQIRKLDLRHPFLNSVRCYIQSPPPPHKDSSKNPLSSNLWLPSNVCEGCERSQGVGVLDWLPLAIPPTHPFGQLDCDITSCSFIWPARKLWESWSHLVMSCLDQLDRSDFLCSSSQLHVHCSAASNQTLGVFTSFLFGHIEPLELVEKSFQQIYMFRWKSNKSCDHFPSRLVSKDIGVTRFCIIGMFFSNLVTSLSDQLVILLFRLRVRRRYIGNIFNILPIYSNILQQHIQLRNHKSIQRQMRIIDSCSYLEDRGINKSSLD